MLKLIEKLSAIYFFREKSFILDVWQCSEYTSEQLILIYIKKAAVIIYG